MFVAHSSLSARARLGAPWSLSVGLSSLVAVASLGAGCAPRHTGTHYQRWTSLEDARKAEEAAEEKAQATAQAAASPAGAKAAKPGAPSAPRAPAPPPAPAAAFNSFAGGETPPVTRTATRTKAVKADDDDVY